MLPSWIIGALGIFCDLGRVRARGGWGCGDRVLVYRDPGLQIEEIV